METDEEVDQLMSHSGNDVGLLLDTGHCLFAGGDPYALQARHRARIVHVHCKDVRPAILDRARRDDMSFMDAVMEGIFTVPGDGCIAFARLLQALRQADYAGWLVVEAEQDPAKAHPLTYASLGQRNLHALAKQAGFAIDGPLASK